MPLQRMVLVLVSDIATTDGSVSVSRVLLLLEK